MRLRVASIAFLLATACIGTAWLSLQPILVRLLRIAEGASAPEALAAVKQARALLPSLLLVDLLVAAILIFAVLQLTLSRALTRTEKAIETLGTVEVSDGLPLRPARSGPLLSRVEAAIDRVTSALRTERATTQRQLADLTAAHAQLTRTQTELVASERLATVGRLAAGVAHEVGNPLSGILGYLSLASSREKDPQISEFLTLIEKEVLRIDGIVRGLLDLGRPARGTPQPVDLRAVLGACTTLLHKAPELREVRIDQALPERAVVQGEAGAVSQILINLLLNAGQAMGGKGELRIHGGAVKETFQLHVDDSGPGIPPDVLPRVFEPFFTTKAGGSGTGLGLAISLHLAQSMGGTLAASARPGGGARFTLSLPAT